MLLKMNPHRYLIKTLLAILSAISMNCFLPNHSNAQSSPEIDSLVIQGTNGYDGYYWYEKKYKVLNPIKMAIPATINANGDFTSTVLKLRVKLGKQAFKTIQYLPVPGSGLYAYDSSIDGIAAGDSMIVDDLKIAVTGIPSGGVLYINTTIKYIRMFVNTAEVTTTDTTITSYTTFNINANTPPIPQARLIAGNPNTGYCGVNLVKDGCFDAPVTNCGNFNFVLNPVYAGQCSAVSAPLGSFYFNNDASSFNPYWNSTGNNSNFFIMDPVNNIETVIWQQTVPVTSGINYSFSHLIRNLCASCNDAFVVELRINGVPIANGQSTNGGLGVTAGAGWVTNVATWKATFSGNASIQIVKLVPTKTLGNDMAIDDISFRAENATGVNGIPVTATANPALFCPGTVVQLNAVATIPGCSVSEYSYSWTSSPNDPSLNATNNTLQNPVVTPTGAVPITYTVSLISTSGCIMSTSSVTVNPTPPPAITLNNNNSCIGGAILSVTNPHAGDTYQWYTSANVAVAGATQATFTPAAAGTYYVKVNQQCVSNSITITFINAPVTVTPTSVITCNNNPVPLCATAPCSDLLPGDLAITMYIRPNGGRITILPLVNIQPCNAIFITTRSWNNLTNTFTGAQNPGNTLTVPPTLFTAGISASFTSLNPATNQLIAYTVVAGVPKLLYGISMDNWNATGVAPTGLTNGFTALVLPNFPSYEWNYSQTNVNQNAFLTAIGNPANWVTPASVLNPVNRTVTGTSLITFGWAGPSFTSITPCSGIGSSSINANLPGTYTVTYTDIHGCVTKASSTIQKLQISSVTAAPSTIYCGATTSLTAVTTPNIPGTVFSWTPQGNPGATPIVGATVTTPALTNTTTYVVTASNPSATCTVSSTVTIQVQNTPSIQVVGSSTVPCGGSYSLTISGTIPPSPPNTFEWITGGLVVGTGSTYAGTAPNGVVTAQNIIYQLHMNGNAACLSNNANVTINPCAAVCTSNNLNPEWATYWGGSEGDGVQSVKISPLTGNLIVFGGTNGIAHNLPLTAGPTTITRNFGPLGPGAGSVDVYLAEVTPDGKKVLWINYIGGTAEDLPSGMDVDNNGNIYITGKTLSPDFPRSSGPVFNGSKDNYTMKFPSGGANVAWSQYLGAQVCNVEGICVTSRSDSKDAVFIAGTKFAEPVVGTIVPSSLPNITNLYKTSPYPNAPNRSNLFATRLDKSTGNPVWSTHSIYCGCLSSSATGKSITFDDNADIYMAGNYTCSTQTSDRTQEFPNGGDPDFLKGPTGLWFGGYDGVVVKMSNAGTLMVFDKFGTAGDDEYAGIKIYNNSEVVLDGLINTTDIPLHRRNSTSLALTNSRVLAVATPGTSAQSGSLEVDNFGNTYMVGTVTDPAFYSNYFFGKPTYRSSKTNNPGSQDMMITKFSGANFVSEWMTYYGSNPFNAGAISGANTVALDAANNVYVGGISNSDIFEVIGIPNIPQPNRSSTAAVFDGVILKFGCNGTPCINCRTSNMENSDLQNNAELNTLTVFPNPWEKSFKICYEQKKDEKYNLSILDINGKVIFEQKLNDSNCDIINDESKLSPGVYFVKLQSETDIQIIRLIKQNQ